MKFKILDLYCGAGGSAVGLHNVGFDIVGVDILSQPNYPFEFIKGDSLEIDLDGYDAYWASPPCQAYTWAASLHRNKGKIYPDLIKKTRELLLKTNKPFVIENVIGAPIRRDLMLCGVMFGLNVIRHRHFEVHRFHVEEPFHLKHKPPILFQTKNGNVTKRSQYCSVAGHGGHGCSFKFEDWKKAMDIDWMTKKELVQAVPPAYSQYIGKYLLRALTSGYYDVDENILESVQTKLI